MATLSCDVAIIGAGTAGLSAERRAREAGAKTLLIDPYFAGTTCATVGCMPSKLLIAASDAARAARNAAAFGVTAPPDIDGAGVLERLRRERDRFVRSVHDTIDDIPQANRITGRAAFIGPDRLRLESGDEIATRATVIATGARPAIPGPFRPVTERRLLTNETLFDLPTLPRSVAVIGAGPLGLEMAQALAGLGVRVALFDRSRTPGGLGIPDVARDLCAVLETEMELYLGADTSAEDDGDGVRVTWNDGQSATFEALLVAAGRPPALDGLDPGRAGLRTDDSGVPVFDPGSLQCGDAPVFIAGDANAHRPLLHEASAEGAIAGENAARYPDVSAGHRTVAFAITFSRPEIALVGRRDTDELLSASCRWGGRGRARIEAQEHGAGCLFAEKDGRLAGAEICAPGAEHLGHLLAWAVERGMSAGDMLDMPFYHPTIEEGLRPALRALCRQSATARPWDRDDQDRPGSC